MTAVQKKGVLGKLITDTRVAWRDGYQDNERLMFSRRWMSNIDGVLSAMMTEILKDTPDYGFISRSASSLIDNLTQKELYLKDHLSTVAFVSLMQTV